MRGKRLLCHWAHLWLLYLCPLSSLMGSYVFIVDGTFSWLGLTCVLVVVREPLLRFVI